MQSQIPDLPQLPESPLSFRSDEITKAHLEYLMEMVEVHGSTGQRPKQFTINVNDQSQIKKYDNYKLFLQFTNSYPLVRTKTLNFVPLACSRI